MLCSEFYENFQNRYIEEHIWLSDYGYKSLAMGLNVSALSFDASYLSIRYPIYHRLQHTIEDGVCLHVKRIEDYSNV